MYIIQDPLWQNIVFDPELRPYIQLDPGIIANLSQEAMMHPDPKQHLLDAVHHRARARRDVLEQVKEEQKMFDRAFLENTAEWPRSDFCPVKTQFWHKQTHAFGKIQKRDAERNRWVVHPEPLERRKAELQYEFETLEALIEVWGVD